MILSLNLDTTDAASPEFSGESLSKSSHAVTCISLMPEIAGINVTSLLALESPAQRAVTQR